MGGEQGRKGLTWILSHQVVQVLALVGRVRLWEVPASDPAQEPFFQQQALDCLGGHFVDLRQGLEQPGLALLVSYAIKLRLAALAEQGIDLPVIDHLPVAQGTG